MENRCLICGAIIPEGREVCPNCEAGKIPKQRSRKFTVIDKHTGEYPDVWGIARRCKWAKHLVYCDIEGFALTEDGGLILMDECGGVAYCPSDRFEIVWEEEK